MTKTRRRSRPSGSSGSSGRDGPANRQPVYPGQAQPPGTFTLVVTDTEGRPLHEYREVFDLELLEFDIQSRNADGIFEPDEEILVTNLKLRNRPGKDRMPTPPDSRIKIYFKQNGYLVGSSGEFAMSESLEPGEEKVFAGPLVVTRHAAGCLGPIVQQVL